MTSGRGSGLSFLRAFGLFWAQEFYSFFSELRAAVTQPCLEALVMPDAVTDEGGAGWLPVRAAHHDGSTCLSSKAARILTHCWVSTDKVFPCLLLPAPALALGPASLS